MIVRQLVWKVFEEAGDGATAAVLAQGLVHEGNRYVAAGGNPMQLKRGIEKGWRSRWPSCAARPAASMARSRSATSSPASSATRSCRRCSAR